MTEKGSDMEVIMGLLQMIQYMTNAINLEAANVLHGLGHCGDLIADDKCPICDIEKRKADEENGNDESKDE